MIPLAPLFALFDPEMPLAPGNALSKPRLLVQVLHVVAWARATSCRINSYHVPLK